MAVYLNGFSSVCLKHGWNSSKTVQISVQWSLVLIMSFTEQPHFQHSLGLELPYQWLKLTLLRCFQLHPPFPVCSWQLHLHWYIAFLILNKILVWVCGSVHLMEDTNKSRVVFFFFFNTHWDNLVCEEFNTRERMCQGSRKVLGAHTLESAVPSTRPCFSWPKALQYPKQESPKTHLQTWASSIPSSFQLLYLAEIKLKSCGPWLSINWA